MRRCNVKLITGIGTDGKERKSAKHPAPSQGNAICNDVQYACLKSRIGCWALAAVIILCDKVWHKGNWTTLSKLQSCKAFSSQVVKRGKVLYSFNLKNLSPAL